MKNNLFTIVGASLLAAGFISLSGLSAKARPAPKAEPPAIKDGELTGLLCTSGAVTANSQGYNACAGAFSGNDTGDKGTLLSKLNAGLFSELINKSGTWTLYDKSDSGDNLLTAANGSTSGSWSLSTPLSGTFVLSLKSSTAYSAYLFNNVSDILGGTFTTNGVSVNDQNTPQGLSHASLFTFTPNQPPTSVPEASSILGLVVIGGTLKVLRRTKVN